jgi:hypothetical protein
LEDYQQLDDLDFLQDKVVDLVVVVEDTVDMVDILVVAALVVDNRDMDEQVDYLFVAAYKHMVVAAYNHKLLLDKAYMNLVDRVLVEDIVAELVDVEVELVQYHEKVNSEDHYLGIKDIGK